MQRCARTSQGAYLPEFIRNVTTPGGYDRCRHNAFNTFRDKNENRPANG